jgi:glycerol-3-phosphate dehydrogenase
MSMQEPTNVLNARNPKALAEERYDLIVVGGGAYGIMTALEAARRGLRAILIERGDFGGATSANSLRIAHGGLRYLQKLDLHRHRESVAERRWFLEYFPDLVRPLPCLMPLYGDGALRPGAFRIAFALDDLLSRNRNAGMPPGQVLPKGRVLNPAKTFKACPEAAPFGLLGGALWYDGFIPDTPRLLIEALRWACAKGTRALNYVEAASPIVTQGRIDGLRARDVLTDEALTFKAPWIVNAAGPWAPAFAATCGAEHTGLFPPSLAWNVVFDRPPPAQCALAIRARRRGAHTYFLVPWKGALLAGTGHTPWPHGPDSAKPTQDMLSRFIAEINEALPALHLHEDRIARVFSGLLPARREGSSELAVREIVRDHAAHGGPAGLISISGVKLTTSRRVADKVLQHVAPQAQATPYAAFARPASRQAEPEYAFDWRPGPGDNAWRADLGAAIADEAVVHLEDLLLRRSSLGDNPARALALAAEASQLFDWTPERRAAEIASLESAVAGPRET